MQIISSKLLLVAFLTLSLNVSAAEVVKKSNSGICHDMGSRHYERTKNFQSFDSISSCLDSGGRLSKGYKDSNASLGARAVDVANTGRSYSRSEFGHGWDDMDGDCQNSRHEALIAQSTGQVNFKTSRKCHVVSGRWISPYSGKVVHSAKALDADHVVPLKWAWDNGASAWSESKRKAFANDPVNLLVVEAGLNRSKGAKGLDEWMPPAGKCQYASRYIRVMKKYDISLSVSDRTQYQAILKSVCD